MLLLATVGTVAWRVDGHLVDVMIGLSESVPAGVNALSTPRHSPYIFWVEPT